ncbi:MAG: hydrogenase maturation protease, partial [Blastocatellia bacterium]|nr:hydrogenase maturation protease [Blastocatellia bacterium]
KEPLPQNVKVEDFGIRGIDLAFEISENYDLVILVDAVKVGAKAGTVFVIEPKSLANSPIISHDFTPNKALQFAQNFANQPKKMLLIGCEPAKLDFNDEMSDEVKNSVEKTVTKILEMISTADERR